jgi:hypothetical protein
MATNTTAPSFPPGYLEADRSSDLLIPDITFSVICPTLVLIRIWSRLFSAGRLFSEDYVLLVALVCTG